MRSSHILLSSHSVTIARLQSFDKSPARNWQIIITYSAVGSFFEVLLLDHRSRSTAMHWKISQRILVTWQSLPISGYVVLADPAKSSSQLTENQLTNLPAEIGQLSNLTCLNVRHAPIQRKFMIFLSYPWISCQASHLRLGNCRIWRLLRFVIRSKRGISFLLFSPPHQWSR